MSLRLFWEAKCCFVCFFVADAPSAWFLANLLCVAHAMFAGMYRRFGRRPLLSAPNGGREMRRREKGFELLALRLVKWRVGPCFGKNVAGSGVEYGVRRSQQLRSGTPKSEETDGRRRGTRV